MKEVWSDIDEFEGFYQISNFGRVKSLPKTMGNNNHLSPEKIMTPKIDKYGYQCVTLCCQKEKGKRKYKTIHRLVATAFINNPNNLKTVNHKDGNKLNNNVNNLEWMTNKDNVQHAWAIGLKEKAREKASVTHGQKCILTKIEDNSKLTFNSRRRVSLFLGHHERWLDGMIRRNKNYEKIIKDKGYTLEIVGDYNE